MAGIHRFEPKDIFEEGAIRRCVSAEHDDMRAEDHEPSLRTKRQFKAVSLLDLFPNYILVISPVNQPVDFPVIGVVKKNTALNSFAKEYVRGLRYEKFLWTIAALPVQELPVGRDGQRVAWNKFVGPQILGELGAVQLSWRRVFIVAQHLACNDLPLAAAPHPGVCRVIARRQFLSVNGFRFIQVVTQ